jgi:hypothetical protein
LGDKLFDSLERYHGQRPWGRVLDAGTGEHSLKWLLGLDPDHITAVTGAGPRADKLRGLARPGDDLVLGNWRDPVFLHGQVYDVVLADYLLGALDGFAPYYQDRLFERLRPHVSGALYFVGLEPFPDQADGPREQLVLEIDRLRDACIKLAGHRCYREYPQSWVERSLERSGFRVLEAWAMPIVYRSRWVNGQLDVCVRKLPYFKDRALAAAMRDHIQDLREGSLAAIGDGLRFGRDYVVIAEPV